MSSQQARPTCIPRFARRSRVRWADLAPNRLPRRRRRSLEPNGPPRAPDSSSDGGRGDEITLRFACVEAISKGPRRDDINSGEDEVADGTNTSELWSKSGPLVDRHWDRRNLTDITDRPGANRCAIDAGARADNSAAPVRGNRSPPHSRKH